MTNDTQNTQDEKPKRTFSEEFETTAGDVGKRLQEIINEGNVRRIVVRTQEGRVLLDTPVTVGAVATGILALTGLLIPVTIGGVLLGVATKLRVEIVREVREGDVLESKQRIQIEDDEDN